MALTLEEKFESRTIRRNQRNQVETIDLYTVYGTDDPRVAELSGPSFGDTMTHDGIRLIVMSKEAVRVESTPDVCSLTVTWGVPTIGPVSSDGEFWQMDLTAGTEHISNVKKPERQLHYPASSNVGTAVGLRADKSGGVEVEGVDIFVPKATLTVTKLWDVSVISVAFLNTIYNISGKVNSQIFKGWNPGDLLFLGARMQRAESGEIPVVYSFMGEATRSLEFKLADGSTVTVPKKGWDYLWQRIQNQSEDIGDITQLQQRAKSIHVANVYDEADFSTLGLASELS